MTKHWIASIGLCLGLMVVGAVAETVLRTDDLSIGLKDKTNWVHV